MTFLDLFLFSVANLKRNKMRTLLTVLGVVIGIAAIVFLVSLGFGLQYLVESKVASMKELTQIQVDPKSDAAITDKQIKDFKKIKGVKWVSPSYYLSSQMVLDGQKIDLTLYALEPKYIEAEDVKVDKGKNLKNPDVEEIVVSRSALKVFDIAEAKNFIGKQASLKIYLKDKKGNISMKLTKKDQAQEVKIAGVTKNVKEPAAYIPINNLKNLDIKSYDKAIVKTKDREVVKDIKKKISDMGYRVSSIKDTIQAVKSYFNAGQLVLGGFGMVALFVASIGIFNTMTISLLERTHEIGIMKAIGATNKDVKRMFIFEAAQIGFWGGVFGLFGGWLMGLLINTLVNILAKNFGGVAQGIFFTPMWFSSISIVFALLVSLTAGIYPARRAGKLNPLEAIRYE